MIRLLRDYVKAKDNLKLNESNYKAIEECVANKGLVGQMRSYWDMWVDPLLLPKRPTEKEVDAKWYKSHKFKGFSDWKRWQENRDYASDYDDDLDAIDRQWCGDYDGDDYEDD